MQYAYVNGKRIEAVKGEKGTCIGCGQKVIAKCGSIKIHHWAHNSVTTCDSWWENETLWHRSWKEYFSENFREVSFYDDVLQEFHRADIYTSDGITIEIQNSPLAFSELQAREQFYPKLIWILNGAKFKGFKVLKSIPNPGNALLNDYEFCISEHLSLVRKTDIIAEKPKPEILNFYHPDLKNIPFSTDFYSFSWKHAHKSWFSASCPVFIDFGGHFLYRMRRRFQTFNHFHYLQTVSKKLFLKKYAKQ